MDGLTLGLTIWIILCLLYWAKYPRHAVGSSLAIIIPLVVILVIKLCLHNSQSSFGNPAFVPNLTLLPPRDPSAWLNWRAGLEGEKRKENFQNPLVFTKQMNSTGKRAYANCKKGDICSFDSTVFNTKY